MVGSGFSHLAGIAADTCYVVRHRDVTVLAT